MRILYLAHRVPYPPDKGDKIRSYHHLRHLADQHDVSLLCFVDRSGDDEWAPVLRRMCRQVEFVRLDRVAAAARGALALSRGQPFAVGYFGAAEMWRQVRRMAQQTFDLAWAYSAHMAQYLAASGARRRVIDFVDVDSQKWRDFASDAHAPLRWGYAIEGWAQGRYEARISASADCVAFASAEEAAVFRTSVRSSGRVQVIPMGVDVDFFQPRDVDGRRDANVLFTGALDYWPNIDAIRFFVREVLPRARAEMPGLCFTAVGHRPSRRLVRANRSASGVRIVGSVPDVRPYFADARVFVAPLRLGRGVKNKVLEAMAMAVPVVASPVAIEGLAVRDGVHLRVARTGSEFATAVVELLRHPERGGELARNARQLVVESYGWEKIWPSIDACLA